MNNDTNIYLDRLRSGKNHLFNDQIDQHFLQQDDADSTFCSQLSIAGKAYLADNYLILNVSLQIECLIPCKICNVEQKQNLEISNFYHSVCLDEIKSQVFSPLEIFRETLIAETPNICECNDGNCPQRAQLKQYFKNGESNGSSKK